MHDWDIEDLLVNWAAWVRAPRAAVGPNPVKAISLESGYSNPQGKGCSTGWGDYYAGLSIPIKKQIFNLDKANKVERCMSLIVQRTRMFLIFHYVYRADPRATCRKVSIRITDYDSVWEEAKKEVGQLLTTGRPYVKSEATAQASKYSVGRPCYLCGSHA